MIIAAAHSLGRQRAGRRAQHRQVVQQFRNPSGRASCSGRRNRSTTNTITTAAAGDEAQQLAGRRAGKTFTSTSVIAVPQPRAATR